MSLIPRLLTHATMIAPAPYWRRHSRQLRRAGVEGVTLILSFDCDTPEDAAAALRIDSALRARGIPATYAVPGTELRRHPAAYQALAAGGAEFINHGSLPHAERRGSRYWSVTFYHELGDAAVIDDIRRGHQDVFDVVGREPQGFRAPHFGLFQGPAQLQLIYRELDRLGYRFATTTIPWMAMTRGPVAPVPGHRLLEFPVSGTWGRPLIVHDSWGLVDSPEHPVIGPLWGARVVETVRQLQRRGLAALLNYYVDPAHVETAPSFLATLDALRADGVSFMTYSQLLRQRRAS